VSWTWKVINQDNRLACRAAVDVLWRRDAALSDPATDGYGFVPIPL
jgi:hypothetical protein